MMTTVIGLALLLQEAKGAWEGKVPWIRDYDQAMAVAKQSGKPLFIFFTCS